MAVTKIWAVKVTPNKTLDYIAKPEKSDNGTLIFSHHCSANTEIAHIQMKAHRQRFNKDRDILLHHGCVSFHRRELSPEEAREVAVEWMQGKFSGYQYFGSVHVDTEHIHFNFTVNSVALDGKKYNGCTNSLNELRAWTDTICEKYGLKVIIPKDKGKSYKEWMEERNELSWKAEIKKDIDAVILESNSFEDFIQRMKEQGYYIKYGENVQHIAFRKKGMQRGCRGRKIGMAYTESAIRKRIQFKEFNFTPGSIKLRRKWKKLSPMQRELWSLKHRKSKLSTTLALGIHYLAGTKEYNFKKIPASQKKQYKSKYDYRIKELSKQLFFVQQNGITTRNDINGRLVVLMQALEKTVDWKEKKLLEKEMRIYKKILSNLEKIKKRKIIPEIEKKRNDPEK